MPELNVFDGGLSTRLAPQFVQPDEATVLENCEIRGGNLAPFRPMVVSQAGVARSFYLFNGVFISGAEDRSYVEYNRRLYYSNGTQSKWTTDGVTFQDLGVSSPIIEPEGEVLTSTFSTVVASGGTIQGGDREYRVVIDDLYTYAQTVNVSTNDSKITMSFTEAKKYELYALIEGKFLSVGTLPVGPGSIEDGASVVTLPIKYGPFLKGNAVNYGTTPFRSMYPRTEEVGMTPASRTTIGPIKVFNPTTNKWTNDNDAPTNALPRGASGRYSQFFTLGSTEYCLVHSTSTSMSINQFPNSSDTHYIYKKDGGIWNPSVLAEMPQAIINSGSRNNKIYDGFFQHYQELFINSTNNIAYWFDFKGGRFYSFNGNTLIGGGVIPAFPTHDVRAFIVNGKYYAMVSSFSSTIHSDNTTKDSYIIEFNLNSGVATTKTGVGQIPDRTKTGGQYSITNDNTFRLITPSRDILSYDTVANIFVTTPGPSLRSDEYIKEIVIIGNEMALLTEYFVITNSYWGYGDYYNRVITYNVATLEDTGSEIGTNNLTGEYTYVLTYSDLGGNNESAPSESSQSFTTENNNIEITNLGDFTNPDAKPYYRLYRIGGNLTKYTLVKELVSTTTSYIDYEPDDIISPRGTLGTQGTSEAPLTAKYMTEHVGRFWCAAHENEGYTKVYYSNLGDPDLWATLQFIQLPKEVTGIGSTSNGLVVFTANETWGILGNNESNFTLRLISGQHGCVSHNSIQNYEGTLLYLSEAGITTCNGGTVREISRDKLEFKIPTALGSAVNDSRYYLLYEESRMLVLDMLAKGALYNRVVPDAVGIGSFDGNLYMSDNSSLLSENSSVVLEEKTQLYISGRLSDGAVANLKEYDKIRIYCSGSFTFTVFISGKLVFSGTYDNVGEVGIERITIPNGENKGYFIEFKVEGSFILNSIEYSVQGRSNG